ncbi:hypothetical protein [Pectobacterium phage Lelidair]|uniref:Uncharacterized protein n=1 Tax=Pectobacterium phage Lelidair TaxID=2320195 RepID=A0A385IFJ0_9CAUD|nr:hypothetical protein HOU13_gp14 [Pectobacterium phage Lelidair]AXY81783.1 hypothetical protein [Pectobacterium phage Lelidair]
MGITMNRIVEPNLVNGLEHVDARYRAEPATETRKKLTALFRVGEVQKAETVRTLSKEQSKEIKEQVYCAAEAVFLNSSERKSEYFARVEKDFCIDKDLMILYARIFGAVAVGAAVETDDNQVRSYYLQHAAAWGKAKMFQLDLPDLKRPDFIMALCHSPRGTSGVLDAVASICNHRGLLMLPQEAATYNLVPSKRGYGAVGSGRYTKHYTAPAWSQLLGIQYTAEDTAWFAGFLTEDDVINLRFRRMRMGAAVKEVTGDDALARELSDKCRIVGTYQFILHPNDVPWGEEYVRMWRDGVDLDSCMSRPWGDYNCPHGVHPCDAYSSAHYGAGDNGLVLVEAQHVGKPVGRGILNTRNNQIVRWYGEYLAKVQLCNAYGIKEDSDALEDSWLAMIGTPDVFAGPYVDGDIAAGAVQESTYRVVLGCDGVGLEETGGYYYSTGNRQRCCIANEDYPEDDMRYQAYNDTWYHPDNTGDYCACECPVTGEYFHVDIGHRLTIDGEEVPVSWAGYDHTGTRGYTNLGGNIGYTRDTEQYRLLANGDWVHADDAVYDKETDDWYTESEYADLISEREEGAQDAA